MRISIHASYANDATGAWSEGGARPAFQSTHRTQTMRLGCSVFNIPAGGYFNPRIVRKRCDTSVIFSLKYGSISIHASYANDATVQRRSLESVQEISIHASYANDATIYHITKKPLCNNFNPRIVRKRCDGTRNGQEWIYTRISIHASYANDATVMNDKQLRFCEISIHASYANDATKNHDKKVLG